MDAKLHARDVILYLIIKIVDEFRSGGADGVGEGNGVDVDVLEPFESILDDFGAPGLVVGIAEGHGDVDDEILVGGFGFAFQGFNEGAGFGATAFPPCVPGAY